MVHYRNQRLFVNAGMSFPQCYSNAGLLDTDKSRLKTSSDIREVTCKHCLDWQGLTDKFQLVHIRLNQGGYDRRGTYWGVGTPLYHYQCVNLDVSDHLRAHSRQDAQDQIRRKYPTAKFYR